MESVSTAVALSYPPGADAPFIAAKARGRLAESVVRIAQENNIPVSRDRVLADVLSVCDVGSCVPPETYEALAKIFAFIQRHERRGSGTVE